MKVYKRQKIQVYVVLSILLVVVMFPVYYAFVMATLSDKDSYSFPPKFLPSFHLIQNMREAWKSAKMGRLMFNSAFIAIVVALAKIVFSILAAFAFTYFGDFKGKYLFFSLILITHMLPLPVRLLPTYDLMKAFKWVNTYYALTVPFFASATGTLLFRQLLLTIPGSLADAARIDGSGPMRFLWHVLLPLSKTNMGTLFLIEFNYIWNEYLWPLIITTTPEMRVVQIGIKMLLASEAQAADWNVIMTGTIMAMLPPLVMLLIFQKTFMEGFSMKEEK